MFTSVSLAHAVAFQAGDLAVLVRGDGANALANTGNQIGIVGMTRAGVVNQTIAVPTTITLQGDGWASNSGLIQSGSGSSEGQISLSTDGSKLAFAGYIDTPGSHQLSSATAAVVQRGYAFVDYAGTYSFGGTFGNSTAYSTNNIRGAATNGASVWGAGANGSPGLGGTIVGLGNDSTPGTEVQLDSSTQGVNTRAVNLFNGNLFFSSQKGTDGIYYFSGFPTSGSPTENLLFAVGNTDSINDFDVSPGTIRATGSHVYVADARVTASGGGVQRWDWNGSAYTKSYTFTVPTEGLRGLAVDYSTNTIFANTPTDVYKVVDGGAAAAMTSIYHITDTVHYDIGGVSLAPVPEPSSIALVTTAGLCGLCTLLWRRRKSAS
jgi:hypothetical protein